MVTKIHNNDFSAVNAAPVALVDFSAVWCGPCRMLAPVLDKIAEDMGDRIAFFNADADENDELAMQFQVTSIPCLVMLKEGKPVAQTVGFQPEPVLKAWIEKNI